MPSLRHYPVRTDVADAAALARTRLASAASPRLLPPERVAQLAQERHAHLRSRRPGRASRNKTAGPRLCSRVHARSARINRRARPPDNERAAACSYYYSPENARIRRADARQLRPDTTAHARSSKQRNRRPFTRQRGKSRRTAAPVRDVRTVRTAESGEPVPGVSLSS